MNEETQYMSDNECLNDSKDIKFRFDYLQHENLALKADLDAFKVKVKNLQDENLELRKNSVNMQVRAEQEEEYISNKLLKKITELKREKESLALNYEQEEEFLTNDLTRKLSQLRDEKANLEKTLEKEQEAQISKLMTQIQKLESEVMVKQKSLDSLRHEKIELENALEQEQEGLVNKLWKKLEKVESEKRMLQSKLDLAPSPAFSDVPNVDSQLYFSMNPNNEINANVSKGHIETSEEVDTVLSNMDVESDHVSIVSRYIDQLRREVNKLQEIVRNTNYNCADKMKTLEREEKHLQGENKRLRKRLQAEIERRQEICRNFSESESSVEIDEERQFNETCRRHGNLTELSSRNRIRTASESSNLSMSGSRSLHCSADYSNVKLLPLVRDDRAGIGGHVTADRTSVGSIRSQIIVDSMDVTFYDDGLGSREEEGPVIE